MKLNYSFKAGNNISEVDSYPFNPFHRRIELLIEGIQVESSSLYKFQNFFGKVTDNINDFGSCKWIFLVCIVIHILVGTFISPVVTSDFERNLFYGEAFWEHGFRVYDMTPLEIDPNYSIGDPTKGILSYPNTTFDYPTIQLLFWAGISLLPFSNVIGKWVLSGFDILNFFLLLIILKRNQESSGRLEMPEKVLTLSYLFFSIPFSASEGQSTAITITFFLLPLVLHSRYKKSSYMSVGVGFFWKYVSFLVLPYMLIKDRDNIKEAILGLISLLAVMVALSFPILFSNFILNYIGFFGKLNQYSGQLPSNNLLLIHICISSLISTAILVFGFVKWIGFYTTDGPKDISFEGFMKRAYWIPFLILLSFLKIYSTAFPWYWMWFYPLIVIFPKNERRLLTKLLAVTFSIGIIDFVDMTVGLGTFI